MSTQLPHVVTRYFQRDAEREIDAIVGLFAAEATVIDEGETRHGTTEIRAWQTGAASKYTYTTEITSTQALGPGSLSGHRPPDGQLPRWRRRPEVGLHDRRVPHHAARHRPIAAYRSGMTTPELVHATGGRATCATTAMPEYRRSHISGRLRPQGRRARYRADFPARGVASARRQPGDLLCEWSRRSLAAGNAWM